MLSPKMQKYAEKLNEEENPWYAGTYLVVDDKLVIIDKRGLALYLKYCQGIGRWRIGLTINQMYRPSKRYHKPILFYRELLGIHGNINIRIIFKNGNDQDYRLANFHPLSPGYLRSKGNANAKLICESIPLPLYNMEKIATVEEWITGQRTLIH
jgi:hypothetical protein